MFSFQRFFSIPKRAVAVSLALMLGVSALSGCGAKKVQDTQMDAYENGTAQMLLGNVKFQVPSDWKAEETEEGRLVAVATDDADTDVAFTFTYRTVDEPMKNSELVDSMLSYESSAVGYPTEQWTTTEFAGVSDAKSVSYTYTVDDVTYDEVGIAVPIGGTACFIVRKTIVDGYYDAFVDDYNYIIDSIELPEGADDDSAAGKAYTAVISDEYTLPSGTVFTAELATNDEDDSLTYLYKLDGDNGNTLSCDMIFLFQIIVQAGQTDYILTTRLGELTATVSTTERSGINTDGSVVEMGFPDWITAEFEQTADAEADVAAIYDDFTAFMTDVTTLFSGGE